MEIKKSDEETSLDIDSSDSDFDDMQIKKDDEILSLSEEEINKILNEEDAEVNEDNQNIEQVVKVLTQEKIKKLLEEYGDLFHFAEDSKAIIEDYDEYFANLKDFDMQVYDLKKALKKYPKLASLLAILMSLSKRIETCQNLAEKKYEREQNKQREQTSQKQKEQAKVSEEKLKQRQARNVAVSQIGYGNRSPKASEFFDVARLGRDGKIILNDLSSGSRTIAPRDLDRKNIKPRMARPKDKEPILQEDEKIKAAKKKPEKEKTKKGPRVERVFTNENNAQTKPGKQLTEGQVQQRLQAYNKDVSARAKSGSVPSQMTK